MKRHAVLTTSKKKTHRASNEREPGHIFCCGIKDKPAYKLHQHDVGRNLVLSTVCPQSSVQELGAAPGYTVLLGSHYNNNSPSVNFSKLNQEIPRRGFNMHMTWSDDWRKKCGRLSCARACVAREHALQVCMQTYIDVSTYMRLHALARERSGASRAEWWREKCTWFNQLITVWVWLMPTVTVQKVCSLDLGSAIPEVCLSKEFYSSFSLVKSAILSSSHGQYQVEPVWTSPRANDSREEGICELCEEIWSFWSVATSASLSSSDILLDLHVIVCL